MNTVNVVYFGAMHSLSKQLMRAIVVLALLALCIGANVLEVTAKNVSVARPNSLFFSPGLFFFFTECLDSSHAAGLKLKKEVQALRESF